MAFFASSTHLLRVSSAFQDPISTTVCLLSSQHIGTASKACGVWRAKRAWARRLRWRSSTQRRGRDRCEYRAAMTCARTIHLESTRHRKVSSEPRLAVEASMSYRQWLGPSGIFSVVQRPRPDHAAAAPSSMRHYPTHLTTRRLLASHCKLTASHCLPISDLATHRLPLSGRHQQSPQIIRRRSC